MLESLIELVKNYEVLYNVNSKDYKDQELRSAAWHFIAEQLNMGVDEVKDTWTKLRNAYASALKRRRYKASDKGCDPEDATPWKYEGQMDFLRCFVKPRKSHAVATIKASPPSSPVSQLDVNTAQCSNASDTKSKNSRHRLIRGKRVKRSLPRVPAKRPHLEPELDDTDQFFLSMSRALKKLHPMDQSRIKFELHKTIHEAEILLLQQVQQY